MTEVQYAVEAGIEVMTKVNGEYVTCHWKLSPDAVKYNASEEITLAEAKELGLIKEEVKTEEPKIEAEVEEKETAKGTQYIHTVTVNGKKNTRKSKNKFNFAVIIGRHDEPGEYMVTYRTNHHDAVAEKDSWRAVAKCWIEEL